MGEGFGLCAGFIFASADDAGSFEIKLRKIGAGGYVRGIEFDGALEFGADFFREAGGGKESAAVGFFAVDAAQPEVIKRVAGIETDGSLAGGDATVPFVEHEVGAAEQILRGRIVRRIGQFLLQGLDGLVDVAGAEQIGRRVSAGDDGEREGEEDPAEHSAEYPSRALLALRGKGSFASLRMTGQRDVREMIEQ